MATASIESKTVMVVFSPKGEATVNFRGLWSRRDITQANVAMLRHLPIHIKKLKEALNAK
jgi:hypothetical protein